MSKLRQNFEVMIVGPGEIRPLGVQIADFRYYAVDEDDAREAAVKMAQSNPGYTVRVLRVEVIGELNHV